MQRELVWATGRSGEEDGLLQVQSDTEALLGRLASARAFSQRAVESARRADSDETGRSMAGQCRPARGGVWQCDGRS